MGDDYNLWYCKVQGARPSGRQRQRAPRPGGWAESFAAKSGMDLFVSAERTWALGKSLAMLFNDTKAFPNHPCLVFDHSRPYDGPNATQVLNLATRKTEAAKNRWGILKGSNSHILKMIDHCSA
eukprot:gnl/TRDRNA2_/TRDRNA2_171702_c1_seq2.p1 gnl/TRDRNA2_/TRDRNA2_171702_c1~~gnl/TRDRNA2_/TRDRNA2_171702_c1_seq2.p1  ORF type:complete len:124 (+),score=8.27 gnl/TRDRNA2_/TRDRNA2_171702_c1_seq2:184-555(+)